MAVLPSHLHRNAVSKSTHFFGEMYERISSSVHSPLGYIQWEIVNAGIENEMTSNNSYINAH